MLYLNARQNLGTAELFNQRIFYFTRFLCLTRFTCLEAASYRSNKFASKRKKALIYLIKSSFCALFANYCTFPTLGTIPVHSDYSYLSRIPKVHQGVENPCPSNLGYYCKSIYSQLLQPTQPNVLKSSV